jgi:hypothetical protein
VVAIRDRRAGGQALAVVVGMDPDTPALIRSFEITAAQRSAAETLAARLLKEIADVGAEDEAVALAALARTVQHLSSRATEPA